MKSNLQCPKVTTFCVDYKPK